MMVYIEYKEIVELNAATSKELLFVQVAHEEMTESAFGAATPSKEVIDKYCDEKGIPIAPKSIKDMLKRVVHTIWDDAINEEDSGLDRMEIFEHDVSRAELRKRNLGHIQPTPMKYILDNV